MADPFITDAQVAIDANPTRDMTIAAQGPAYPDAADVLGQCVPRSGDAACYVVGFSDSYAPIPDAGKTARAVANIVNKVPVVRKLSIHVLIDIDSAANVATLADPNYPGTAAGQLLQQVEDWCAATVAQLTAAGQVDATYHGRVSAASMQSLVDTITADFFTGFP